MLGVDDFSLRRGHRYATILIDVVTHARVDVLPDRTAQTLIAWLRDHSGVEIVCRDGSATYAQAVTDALPDAAQVSDRWHLWHNLAAAVEKTVAAHASCWRAAPTEATPGSRNERTLQRHAAVHESLESGVGLCETARHLGLALNTVKRYARISDPDQLLRPPQYRRCLVDPFRGRCHVGWTGWDDLQGSSRILPGSCTARVLRHGANAADIAVSRPLLRTVSTNNTAPACETAPRPPPSTRTRGYDPILFFT